jgi:hypothetical protein
MEGESGSSWRIHANENKCPRKIRQNKSRKVEERAVGGGGGWGGGRGIPPELP